MTLTNKLKSKLERVSIFASLIGFAIATSSSLFGIIPSAKHIPYLLPIGIFGFSVALYFVASKSKFVALLRATAILMFLHALVFPFIYLLLISINPKSISFDEEIYQNVVQIAASDLNINYSPKELNRRIEVIKSFITDSTVLNHSIEWLDNGNLIVSDSHIITVNQENTLPDKGGYTVDFYNKSGSKISTIFLRYNDFSLKDCKDVKDFLKSILAMENVKLANYVIESKAIESKDIWTFNRVLPYSINIFNSKVIKPISGLANLIVFIHQILVVVITIGIIAAIVRDIFIKKAVA
ncbi:MAG: hypothetical protein V4619_01735 [Bacteroidota bacterium]